MVGAIQMQIPFVHFLSRNVEDLNSAEGRLDVFCEPNPDFVRRFLHCASHAWLGLFEKSVGFKVR
jgi:hypothetical protein